MDKILYTINVYSENIAGILNQITTIFTRRQLNIETLSVSASSIEGIHKYTITVYSDAETIEKVTKQIERRVDVIQAHYYTDDQIIYQEVALYKVPTNELLASNKVERLVRKYNARILEVNQVYTVIELTGHPDETQALYDKLMRMGGLLQFVRSGRIAITRSPVDRLSNFLTLLKNRSGENGEKQ